MLKVDSLFTTSQWTPHLYATRKHRTEIMMFSVAVYTRDLLRSSFIDAVITTHQGPTVLLGSESLTILMNISMILKMLQLEIPQMYHYTMQNPHIRTTYLKDKFRQ